MLRTTALNSLGKNSWGLGYFYLKISLGIVGGSFTFDYFFDGVNGITHDYLA